MRVKSTLIATVIAFVAIVGLISSVNALEPSLWTSGGEIKKQLLIADVQDYNSEKYCNVEEKYELFYQVTWPTKAFSYRYPIKTCWYKTNLGEVGMSDGRIYITSPSGENVIRTSEVIYNMFYPLGQNDKIAMTANNGSSFFRYLYIYDNFESRLTLTTSSNAEIYSFNRQNPWRLNDGSGNGLNMNHMDQSQNGEWLIVEGINGFMRINTRTKEIVTFEAPLYGYGSGVNPTYQLTISNSGRYAIISGGNISSRLTYIYDLESCQQVVGQPTQVASGCGKRNLKDDAFPGMTNMQALGRTIFSADDTNITVDVPGGNPYNRYVITSPLSEPHYIDYLALGDSYSSGEGEYQNDKYMPGTDGDGGLLVPWNVGISDFPYRLEKCHLSTRSYPYLLAQSAGATDDQFHSIACSGSKVNDVINSDNKDLISRRYNGRFNQFINVSNPETLMESKSKAVNSFIPGRAAQIEFVQKYKPKVATIGIGGNDIDFAGKIKSCIIPMSCSWATDLRYASAKQIQTDLYKSLDGLYEKLKAASSDTTFIAIGYPNVISENDDSCAPNVLLNGVERRYAVELVNYMNVTIKAVAAKHKIKYLDISDSLQGDRLCDESYDGKAVQALALGDDYGVPVIVSTPFGPKEFYVGFGAESYHPTHTGHQMIASKIRGYLGSSNIANYDPCPDKNYAICFEGISTSAPSIPQYFTEYAKYQPEYVTEVTTFEGAIGIEENEAVRPGQAVDLVKPTNATNKQIKLAPTQAIPVTMHSTPQQVGTMSVDVSGQVSGSITIPQDAEPGPHTLVINAKDSLYRDMTMYQQIFVYDTIDDFDGDGVQNVDEKCGMFEPINQDEDNDGVDDACDGVISEPEDTTPPTVTPTVATLSNANGWYNQAVVVNWTVTDDTDTETVAPASLTAAQEGEHTYNSSEVCDAAGNCATGSVTLKIDTVAPVVNGLTLSKNPKAVGEISTMSASISDETSGATEAEYFIADDPGLGNGATMMLDLSTISTQFGTDFGTGVYKISARAQDQAGNWSMAQSDFLVVYDASSGVRFRGARSLSLVSEGNQLPWVTVPTQSTGKFAFSVRYGNDGAITKHSDFQFAYKTGDKCYHHRLANNCHNFELNSTRIAWLTTSGVNQSLGTFSGDGVLTMDKQSQPVRFVVHGVDGERMSPFDEDQFSLTIYASMASEPMYFVAPTNLKRGDIKIRF